MQGFNLTRVSTVVAAASLAVAGIAVPAPALADRGAGPDPGSLSAATTAVPAPVSADLLKEIPSITKGHNQTGSNSRVLDYWTPERMKNAAPMDTPGAGATLQRGSTPPSPSLSNRSAAPLTEVAAPAPAADGQEGPLAVDPVTNFSRTNGKVFFSQRDEDKPEPEPDVWRNYECSGSAVNSGSKRLVITAGHCVHGGPGGTWHRNWVFVPQYADGEAPHGKFEAGIMRTFNDWINYGESGRGFNSDVAFVATRDNEDRRVVNAVGGHGLRSGGSHEFDVSIFGYPGNKSNGQFMWACWGTTGIRSIQDYRFPSITGCDFGGGSSGGPWLHEYSNSSGQGYVRSVTSHGPRNSTEYISGPYFDERVPKLYQDADEDGRTL